jgi:hypothetical protein
VSTDILEAGARAYVRALSNAIRRHDLAAAAGGEGHVEVGDEAGAIPAR